MVRQKSLEEMKGLPPDQQKELFKRLKSVRHTGKQVNYSATYGAGPTTIARGAGIDIDTATKLHTAYWKLNWSVPASCVPLKVKTVNGQKWQLNPVSGLWYSLRAIKDQWSTLNQGTGVWAFDTWVKHLRSRGVPVCAQMHDEICAALKIGRRERATRILRQAIDATNDELKLNRELDISIDFGPNYSTIH